MIPTPLRSDRSLLAVSFVCFGIAGLVNVTADALVPTIGATAIAIVGVYAAARYAGRVDRRTLAQLAFALWIGFLTVAGLHAIGLETVATALPGDSGTLVASLTAITWGTLGVATSSTAFLGFREYGRPRANESAEEQVLDGDTSEYSTR